MNANRHALRAWDGQENGTPDYLQGFSEALSEVEGSRALLALYGAVVPVLVVVNAQVEEEEMPIGAISAFGGTAAPTGWLICDGAVVPDGSNPALAAVLGTRFIQAGDPAGTVRLPDMRSRFALGAHPSFNEVGERGGASGVFLQTRHLPPHAHTTKVNRLSTTAVGGASQRVTGPPGAGDIINLPSENAGGGDLWDTLPPFVKILYIIRALP